MATHTLEDQKHDPCAHLRAQYEELVEAVANGALSHPPIMHLHGNAAETFKLQQQRDELLAALKEALGWNWLDDDAPTHLLDKYNALIAKAEQS